MMLAARKVQLGDHLEADRIRIRFGLSPPTRHESEDSSDGREVRGYSLCDWWPARG